MSWGLKDVLRREYPIPAQIFNWPVTIRYKEDNILDVVGITEIAVMFGVDRVTVSRWHSQSKLPVTDAQLTKRPLWERQTILRWAEQSGREVLVEGPFSHA